MIPIDDAFLVGLAAARRIDAFAIDAFILKAEERLPAYPWSSWPAYLAAPEHRPQWVRVDRLLAEHGLQEDTAAKLLGFSLFPRSGFAHPGAGIEFGHA